ncbi:MAG: CPBP family intramembrane metalloprotease [Anaerolineae bacterium]|nr:CPBP family intramembrane metalloprotease [Anaerolineae bacterium]
MAGLALLYVLLLTAVANIESALSGRTRVLPALMGILPVALLVLALSGLLNGGALTEGGGASLSVVLAIVGLVAALMMFAIIGLERPWQCVSRVVKSAGRYESITFDPRSGVHRLATLTIVFALTALSWGALNASDAEPLAFADVAPQLLVGSLMYLALAVIGVGWLTRRDWTAVKQRLGLRWPRPADCLAGIAAAIALHLMAALAMAYWQASVSQSTFESQVSGARLLYEALTSSLLLGGLLAMSVGIGEEILFRGALQPVFGIVISSLLFVAMHTQYAFTPAAAILFVVSLGFGLLRARVSTTAAIIAHAGYNAIPFALTALA